MYSKNKQICPCCGKTLYLILPTEELLPNRFGVSKNGISFYLISDLRHIPYTMNPKSMSEFNSEILSKDIKIGYNSLLYRGNTSNGRYDQGRYKIITVPRAEKMLKHNLLIFPAMYVAVFFCRNCRAKLALNFYPASVFDSIVFLGVFAFSILFVLQRQLTAVALAFYCLFSLIVLVTLLSCVLVKLFMSNFVVTDNRDNMIIPNMQLKVARKGLKSIFLHRSNIFEIEFDREKFCLYLVEKGKVDLKLHICGIEGEQERMLALIREKQERGEKVVIPLMFEGKFVGNAEVLETYDPPQFSNEER